MKTQTAIHRTSTGDDDESRFSSFRYELESGAHRIRFVVALIALVVVLALALFSLKR
jgi:hypothetical protein